MNLDPIITLGSVTRYDEKSGTYYIRTANEQHGQEHPASLLGALPFNAGDGLKGTAAPSKHIPCIILQIGKRYFIMGFIEPYGFVEHSSPQITRPIKEGETFLYHNTGSRIGFNDKGSVLLWASKWANAVFNQFANQLVLYCKHFFMNLYTAFIKYEYDDLQKTARATMRISKEVDEFATKGKNKSDQFTVQLGALENGEHLIEGALEQSFLQTTPNFKSKFKLGQQADGTFIDLKTEYGLVADPTIFQLKSNTNTKTEFTITKDKSEAHSIKAIFDPHSNEVVNIIINKDKAQLIIDENGNITIKTIDNALIKLGGQGKEQQLVTKNWIEQIFKNHIHSNGNQGAPTGTLIGPAIVPTSVDSSSGHLTQTVRAE
jgi:hypothetical protein